MIETLGKLETEMGGFESIETVDTKTSGEDSIVGAPVGFRMDGTET